MTHSFSRCLPRPVFSAAAVIAAAAFAVFALSGCMDYVRPPLAVDADAYTTLTERDKFVLPPDLKVLTLEKAQEIALANNPDLQSVRFTVDAARSRYYRTFSGYAPTLNAGMSIGQSFNRMHSREDSLYTRSQSERYRPSLSGQLLIFDCLAREMNILSAKYAWRSADAGAEDARRLLLRAVAYSYNDLLLAQAQKKIVQAEMDYSRRMLEDAENKLKAGTALLSDVLNFRVNLRNGELAMTKVDYSIAAGRYVLAGYLGLTDGTLPADVVLPDAAMPEYKILPDVGIYIDQALANRPDLRGMRELFKSNKYAYYGTYSAFGPSVTADYSLSFEESRSLTRGDVRDSSRTGTGSFSYGISASWNLFNGFGDYFNVRSALAELARTDYELARTCIEVVTDVRTAYENYVTSVEQANLSREICDLTLHTRELVDNEYKAGSALVTRVNEAERDLVEAQNNLATAVINIANARAQLEAAVYAGARTEHPQNDQER